MAAHTTSKNSGWLSSEHGEVVARAQPALAQDPGQARRRRRRSPRRCGPAARAVHHHRGLVRRATGRRRRGARPAGSMRHALVSRRVAVPPRNCAIASSERGSARAASSAFLAGSTGWSEREQHPAATAGRVHEAHQRGVHVGGQVGRRHQVQLGHLSMYWMSSAS